MAQDDFIQSAFKELHLRSAEDAGGFHVSSMNECLDKARSLPPLVTLYPNVVLEGDLCVIFGQSGIGKTIFAMQVARDIAASGRRVLYADFEMTPRQLALRYGTARWIQTTCRRTSSKALRRLHLPTRPMSSLSTTSQLSGSRLTKALMPAV